MFVGQIRANPDDITVMQRYNGEFWADVFDFKTCLCVEGDVVDFRQNPANNCQLQYTHNGQDWLLAFDYSLCKEPQPTNYRYTDGGDYEESYDDGQTWTPAPERDERKSGVRPDPYTTGVPRCISADGLRTFLANLVAEVSNAFSATITLFSLLAIVVAVLAIIFSAGTLTTLATIILPFVSFMLELGANGIAAQFTTAFWDDFKCICYCHLGADGVYTDAVWSAIMADLEGHAELAYRGAWLAVRILGPVGCDRAAHNSGANPATADCSDCDCGDCPSPCTELAHAVIDGAPAHAGCIWSRPDLFVYPSGYVQLNVGDWLEYHLGSSYCVMKVALPTADFAAGTQITVKIGDHAPFDVTLQNNHNGQANAGFVFGVSPPQQGDKIRITAKNGTVLNSDMRPYECVG